MSFNNLSKEFKYVNAEGGEITFLWENGYLLNKPKGIDSLNVSHSQSHGIDQIGSTIQASSIQPRAINVSGILSAAGSNKDRLLTVIRPDLWGRFYADEWFLDVKPSSTPAVGPGEVFADFAFSLIAPYPYWQSTQTKELALSGVEPGFKLPCNFTETFRFGTPISLQYINAVNAGQVPVPFTVTILANGDVENPKLINMITGEFLELEKTLSPGERIIIETTHARTNVTSSVDGDIRGALTLDSTLFRLNVGDNLLKPDADSGKSDMEMSVSFAIEKVGVTV